MTTLLTRILLAAMLLAIATPGRAADKFTMLFAAPNVVPAFVPLHIAKAKGYFAARGLDPEFIDGKGGADVAKQVAVGNADFGCAIGDTPIFVRPNGLPVRGVAMLGQGSLSYIFTRKDRGIQTLADLKGKRIGVVSFQNANYYALLATLAAEGIRKQDVSIESVGPAGIFKLMMSGDLDAISNVVENAQDFERMGLEVQTFPVAKIFPALPQVILASDEMIAKKPELVGKVIAATLQAIGDIIANPDQAAKDYVASLPQYRGQEQFYSAVLRRYVADVYKVGDIKQMALFDPKRLETVQKFYLDNGIITKPVPVEDLYTNKFVQ